MEGEVDVIEHKEAPYGTDLLLSNDQIYFILNKSIKLSGKETSEAVLSVLESIINTIYLFVKKTPDLKPNKLRNQSIRQILTQQEVFFMNTCLEYSLITLLYMKNAGFEKTNLIIEELSSPNTGFKLHFGVEGIHDNTTYYVDHKFRNTVFVGKGHFASKYVNEPTVNRIVIPGDKISLDDTLQDLINKGLFTLKYFSLELLDSFKKKFQKDNTPLERQEGFLAKVQHPQKPEIFIENEIN